MTFRDLSEEEVRSAVENDCLGEWAFSTVLDKHGHHSLSCSVANGEMLHFDHPVQLLGDAAGCCGHLKPLMELAWLMREVLAVSVHEEAISSWAELWAAARSVGFLSSPEWLEDPTRGKEVWVARGYKSLVKIATRLGPERAWDTLVAWKRSSLGHTRTQTGVLFHDFLFGEVHPTAERELRNYLVVLRNISLKLERGENLAFLLFCACSGGLWLDEQAVIVELPVSFAEQEAWKLPGDAQIVAFDADEDLARTAISLFRALDKDSLLHAYEAAQRLQTLELRTSRASTWNTDPETSNRS